MTERRLIQLNERRARWELTHFFTYAHFNAERGCLMASWHGFASRSSTSLDLCKLNVGSAMRFALASAIKTESRSRCKNK